MSPISSGKDSSLLECRNSTVAFFQLPICEGKKPRTRSHEPTRLAVTDEQADHTISHISTNTYVYSNVHTRLRGKLGKEVVICCKGADADTLADGRGQGFDLIETAVQLIQRCQADAARSRRRKIGGL